MHLTLKDLRWASAQIAADEIAPKLEQDIRRVVKRHHRYLRDRQIARARVMQVAQLLSPIFETLDTSDPDAKSMPPLSTFEREHSTR